MAPSRRRGERAQRAAKWLCRFCKHKTTGQDWWNVATAASCGMCGRAKGICFKAEVAPNAPSVHVPPRGGTSTLNPWSKGAKELEMLRKKVERLEAAQAPPPGRPGAAAPEFVDVEMSGEPSDDSARQRLQELDKELVAVSKHSGPAWLAGKQELEEERERLRVKLLESKPIHARLRTVTARLEAAERQLLKAKESLGKEREGLAALLRNIGEAETAIQQQEQNIKDLAKQRLGEVLQRCGIGDQASTVAQAIIRDLPNIVSNTTLVPAGAEAGLAVAAQPQAAAEAPAAGAAAGAVPPRQPPEPAEPAAASMGLPGLPRDQGTIECLSNAELRTLMATVVPPASNPLEDAELRETARHMFCVASLPRSEAELDVPSIAFAAGPDQQPMQPRAAEAVADGGPSDAVLGLSASAAAGFWSGDGPLPAPSGYQMIPIEISDDEDACVVLADEEAHEALMARRARRCDAFVSPPMGAAGAARATCAEPRCAAAAAPRAGDSLTLLAINGDTWSGARRVLEWNAAAKRQFDVVFIQETRFPDGEAAGAARQWCLGQGCHLALGPPLRVGTERLAVSGGVGLCSAAHVGVRAGIDVPSEWAHRIVARKIHLGEGSVFLCLSVYLITSIGLTGDNITLLAEVAALVGQHHAPFLSAGDWNVDADDLASSGWLDEIDGLLISSGVPTCGGNDDYDYFVVSRSVSCSLDRVWSKPKVWVENPRRPFSVAKKPEVRPATDAGEAAGPRPATEQETQRLLAELQAPLSDLQAACAGWFDLAERSLIRSRQVEASKAHLHRGRGRGIRLVERPLLDVQERRQRRHDSSDTEAWWSFLRIWRALLRWGRAPRGSKAKRSFVKEGLMLHGRAITLPPAVSTGLRLSAPSCCRVALVTTTPDAWLGLAERNSPLAPWFEGLLDDALARRRSADAAARARLWRDFRNASLAGSGRVVHKLIKPKPVEPGAICLPGGAPGLPQVGALAVEAIVLVPRTLGAISVDQVRTASLSFGRRKGLGWDNFHPRLLSELSDPLVERFTAILNQFEGSAEVPDLWTTMTVFIPKPPPDVGRRPIGLMEL
ncbi:unnamed protein product, partial [Prorocentrum cordatum]